MTSDRQEKPFIDPQAVFISQAGEVKVFSQWAGESRVREVRRQEVRPRYDPSLSPIELVPVTDYLRLEDAVRSLATRTAILNLLAERQERDDLLDRAFEALDDLMHRALNTQGCAQATFNTHSDLRARSRQREEERKP